MIDQDLKKDLTRLVDFQDIKTCKEILQIFIECYFHMIQFHYKLSDKKESDSDAKILTQMMFSKLVHINSLLDLVKYVDRRNNKILNDIIDPIVIASIVRNMYETACTFNLIYRSAQSEKHHKLFYWLWSIAGLKDRSVFVQNVESKENLKKLENERKQIENYKTQIEELDVYINLEEEKGKKRIQHGIKKRNYRFVFEANQVNPLDWQKVAEVMGCKDKIFNNMYRYFSIYSHPSNASVFPYKDMFNMQTKDYLKIVVFNMRYCFMINSIFIADYLKSYTEVLVKFESLNYKDQFLINYFYVFARDKSYTIKEELNL